MSAFYLLLLLPIAYYMFSKRGKNISFLNHNWSREKQQLMIIGLLLFGVIVWVAYKEGQLMYVGIALAIALMLKLAQWGDRKINKKNGYDNLSKEEIKKREKKKAIEAAENIPDWVGVVVLIGVVFLIFKGCSSINLDLSPNKDTEAYYMCKHFIKKELNDPKSLDFPRSDTAHITSSGDTYDIAGSFRANNAFGAKIQSSYACTVTENPNKGTWTLDYLSEF